MRISWKQLVIALTLMTVGGGVGLWSSRYLPLAARRYESITTVPAAIPPVPSLPPTNRSTTEIDSYNFIAAAVEQVGPAVVRINATRKVASRMPDAFNNPLLRRFFGSQPQPEERTERGTGSGFILSRDGRLLTNAHVVADTDTVQVTLKDGRSFTGKVLGVDPVTDVAVVKIKAQNLPTVKIGDSKRLVPGQWAIAIGNPLGLDNTVTVGIISAIDRSSAQVGVPNKRVNFIQTDAAINPGNSGGPLLNGQGEVIGVNTAIRADAQGLGFAIPIQTAAKIADQLFSKGQVEHPFLGIQMVDLTETTREELNQEANLNIQLNQGVAIVRVVEQSPSEQAGLRAGDIIQKIDGIAIAKAAEVQEYVESSQIGAELNVEVNRQGKIQTLTVKPEALPANELG